MEKRIDGWGRLGRRGRWKKGSLLGLLDWIRKPNMGREREMKASKSEWQIWIDKAKNKLIWGSGLKHKRTNKKLDLGRTCSLPLKGNSTTLAIQSWELWEIFKTPLLLEPQQGHCCLFDGQGQGDILHTSLGTAGTMRGDRHKRRKGRQKTWCWVTAADRRVWAHHVTAGDSLNARWGEQLGVGVGTKVMLLSGEELLSWKTFQLHTYSLLHMCSCCCSCMSYEAVYFYLNS